MPAHSGSGHSTTLTIATRDLFRWLSLMVTTPVVFYAAAPFFAGAMRLVSARRLGMDVPVTLAVGLIYAGSVVEVVTGGPESGSSR